MQLASNRQPAVLPEKPESAILRKTQRGVEKMNLQSIKKNIQKNGLRGALKKYTKKAAQMTLGIEDHEK